ncbi:MAG: ABC transporter permease [Acidimicrobiales bacterium]
MTDPTVQAAMPPPRPSPAFWRVAAWVSVLRSELKLVFGRLRTKALLLALAAVPVSLSLVLRFTGPSQPGQGPSFVAQVTHNGVFAAVAGLTVVVPFLLPLCVAVVAGDALAGEASAGTIRYLLSQPVSRTSVVTAKLAAVLVFCLAGALSVAAGGLAAGAALFPIGPVTTLSGTTITLAAGSMRILAGAAVVGASMMGLAGVGVFVSTLTENPPAAMAATVAVGVTSEVLDALPQLASLHHYLLSHYWDAWAGLMRAPIDLAGVGADLTSQAAYLAIFAAAAWARFSTADVTS